MRGQVDSEGIEFGVTAGSARHNGKMDCIVLDICSVHGSQRPTSPIAYAAPTFACYGWRRPGEGMRLLAISARDRNAALTAAAFGNTSTISGSSTTTFELACSRAAYLPRTSSPNSDRLYSGRSASSTALLAFFIDVAARKTYQGSRSAFLRANHRDHYLQPTRRVQIAGGLNGIPFEAHPGVSTRLQHIRRGSSAIVHAPTK